MGFMHNIPASVNMNPQTQSLNNSVWNAFPFRSISVLCALVCIPHWRILRARLMEEMQSAALPVSNQPHWLRHWSGWGSVVVVVVGSLIVTLKRSLSLRFKWSEHSASQTRFLSQGGDPDQQKEQGRIKMELYKHLSEAAEAEMFSLIWVGGDKTTHGFALFSPPTTLNGKQMTQIPKKKYNFLFHSSPTFVISQG